jgi:heterodisulfide reductase subunit B
MELCYYPGCTLKTTGKNFETPAIASMEALGHPMVELERWNCCGTVHSLAGDELMLKLAPVRTLMRVKEAGAGAAVTLCAVCYSTLKQTNTLMKDEPAKRDRINSFMDDDEDYDGSTNVLHLLEFLRDVLGFDALAKAVKKPLEGLKLSAYYGCLLLRPEDAAIDDPEAPKIMEDLTGALGGQSVESPFRIECCGSYHTVDDVDPVVERAKVILEGATARGADALVVACPLCFFNLDYRQKDVAARYRNWRPVPIFYFTQLMALALGLDEAVCLFDDHQVDPRPLLRGLRPAEGGGGGA